MEPIDVSTQSFIVKIWAEKTADDTDEVVWRGHITHVISGEQLYFESLEEIRRFMNPYLQELDTPNGGTNWLEHWVQTTS